MPGVKHPSFDRDLDPIDRLFAAVCKQAIEDARAGGPHAPTARAWLEGALAWIGDDLMAKVDTPRRQRRPDQPRGADRGTF